MSDNKKLVVVVTSGFNDERSSVAWSVANGAIGSDMQVTMFLVSSGVDWVRKGGRFLVCPPCAGVRGYQKEDPIDGVTLAGSVAMLDEF